MIGSSLQKAIYETLMADPAAAGGRIFDRVPANAVFPYITIGDEQILDDGNSCGEGWEAYADIHLWSRPVAGSKVEVKDLAAQVANRLLRDSDLWTLENVWGLANPWAGDGFPAVAPANLRVVVSAIENMRFLRDPDGLTEHGIVTMRYLLDPA